MKNLQTISFVLLVALLALTACHSEEVRFTEEEAFGQLNLSALKMKAETEPLVSVSRATEELGKYDVVIYTEADKRVDGWKYNAMPEVFTLKTGAYKIHAKSPKADSGFDAPIFASDSLRFEIRQDEITEVGELICRLASIKVTIAYDEKLQAVLGDDVKVSVGVGKEEITFTKDETRAAFFNKQTEKSTVDVVFEGSVEGEPVKISKSYADIEPGTELAVTYNFKESVSGVDPETGGEVELSRSGIIISNEVIRVDESASILPDEGEILDFGEPKIEGEGFDIKEPILNADQSPKVIINLMAPEGIAHAFVEITSTNSEFSGIIKEMFGENNPFDLAYPGELGEVLGGFGFPLGEQVINQQKVPFNVTEFIPLLTNYAGTHKFNLKLKDTTGKEVSETLTVITR